jgi:hypothetical protein
VSNYPGRMGMSKVRIRLMSETKKDLEKLRNHMLKKHPQMIMSKPRMGSNPKYHSAQKWFCYGDYEFGKIRRRRGE